MSKEHVYETNLLWTGNTGDGTRTYRGYSRAHEISVDGKPVVGGSSDPNFNGDRTRYNPEELLVASLSSCHMLWYLHLCSAAKIVVTGYADKALGVMVEIENGGGRFSEVTLKPRVIISSESDAELANQLHARAHELCFVANSVNFPVRAEAVISIEKSAAADLNAFPIEYKLKKLSENNRSQISIRRVFVYSEDYFVKMIDDESGAEIFNQLRRRLFGIAYRMLGTRADAEDVVQETYLRWHKSDLRAIESPEAWLVTIATRLSIDRLRILAKERESYVGPWLPEPLFGAPIYTPEERLEFASNLSLAFMMLLERLSPTERAAFLLREVFDVSYEEIARIVEKSETACRQLIHRARTRVRNDKPRFSATNADRRRLIEKFIAAVNTSDEAALVSLFAEDARLTADSGGKVSAARKIIDGRLKIVRLFYHLGIRWKGSFDMRIAAVNGELGIVTIVSGQPFSATALEFDGERIKSIYQVMNPEKLKSFIEIDAA